MKEVSCFKSVIEGQVKYVPVADVNELQELYAILLNVQGNDCLFGNQEVNHALTVLRVFAYNLVNSVVGSDS